MISSMEAGRGEGRQNRYREKKRPADKRFVIEPPRLYSRQGIFSQPPSGGAIRHWPPVPARDSLLKDRPEGLLSHMKLPILKEEKA